MEVTRRRPIDSEVTLIKFKRSTMLVDKTLALVHVSAPCNAKWTCSLLANVASGNIYKTWPAKLTLRALHTHESNVPKLGTLGHGIDYYRQHFLAFTQAGSIATSCYKMKQLLFLTAWDVGWR